MDNRIKIRLIDKTFSHCEFSNNPIPIINKSKFIEWVREDSDNELVVYTDSYIKLINSTNSIAWLLEPEETKAVGYRFVRENFKKFSSVWTWDKVLLETIPNTVFYPVGGCWIEPKDRVVHKKTKLTSMIFSKKKKLPGHILRHKIFDNFHDKINYFQKIKNKIEGLKDFMFHVVVESVKKDFYFTEKLIDSFITGTIPVYWGCPSICNFFNTDGMIIFNDINELNQKLEMCTKETYYNKLPAVLENYELAKKYVLAEDWIYNNILHK
tara:strand:- start:1037 stop:1840 length:804 start_codon:yes stop_codon:yes gene_type:complete